MNLRTVTIWTALLLLIITITAPIYAIALLIGYGVNEMGLTNFIPFAFMVSLLIALPLVISCFIIKEQEHVIPIIVLLVATIAHGIWYVFLLWMLFVSVPFYPSVFAVFWLVHPTAWIIVLALR